MQFVTARDLAMLARYLIMTYPEYYPIFSEPEFEWNKIKQANRNSLVEMGIGVDGLKTGHTEAAGYGTVVSSNAGERRIIAVLHGLGSMSERAEEARKLITYGLRSFEVITAFAAGPDGGLCRRLWRRDSRRAADRQGLDRALHPARRRGLPAGLDRLSGPAASAGRGGRQGCRPRGDVRRHVVQITPLYAAETVEQGDIFRQSMDALKHLAIGWL